MTTLEPMEPERAVELYLAEKQNEYAKSTVQSHRSRLRKFLDWCAEEGIGDLNDLSGRRLHEYRIWRRDEGDLAPASEKTQMDTLRVFVRWCESVDAVEPDLHVKVQSPSLSPDESARDVLLEETTATAVLEYLRKYQYASIEHVTLTLLWHTMMRRGTVRALDVGDYHPDEQFVEVVHRPDTDTPIKNGSEGERMVALSGEVCTLLDDWLGERRPDVTDDHGREPLMASPQGRIHASTVQQYCYLVTRPCAHSDDCPHGRDVDTCEAAARNSASKCPSSVSPHAVRRGSITHHLQSDVPEKAVGDRANVSQDVLERHYDRRTAREKMEQRRGFLGNI